MSPRDYRIKKGEPVLSICIPTSNRADYLDKCINSIVIQQPYMEGKVEIVISDNSDNDDSLVVFEKYKNKYNNICYFKNEKNIGALNYAHALARGTGLYRKLSNDTIIYNHRSLTDMVYTVEQYMDEKPVLLWTVYHRADKDFVKTSVFETVMRTMSYYSTAIFAYGIWFDEAEGVIADCEAAKKEYQKRFRSKREDDIVAQRRFPITDIAVDTFWHLRYMKKQFAFRKTAVIVDSARNWTSMSPPKKYDRGVMKWFFYDYYMDILRQYESESLISKQCVEDLERDVGFSFFVKFMIDFEFPNSNIEYDPTDTFIQDILDEYRNKDYFDELYAYYRLKRQQRIEELNHNSIKE